MNGLYAAKFSEDWSLGFKYHGGGGNRGPMQWKQLVGLIAEKGIKGIKKVRHADKEPKNYRQLNAKELLELWKAVEARRNSN